VKAASAGDFDSKHVGLDTVLSDGCFPVGRDFDNLLFIARVVVVGFVGRKQNLIDDMNDAVVSRDVVGGNFRIIDGQLATLD